MDDLLQQCKSQLKIAKKFTTLQDVMDEIKNLMLVPMNILKEELATASANLMSMKDGLKQMAEEEGVTPKDLLGFMERNCPQLPSSLMVPQPPTPAAS